MYIYIILCILYDICIYVSKYINQLVYVYICIDTYMSCTIHVINVPWVRDCKSNATWVICIKD